MPCDLCSSSIFITQRVLLKKHSYFFQEVPFYLYTAAGKWAENKQTNLHQYNCSLITSWCTVLISVFHKLGLMLYKSLTRKQKASRPVDVLKGQTCKARACSQAISPYKIMLEGFLGKFALITNKINLILKFKFTKYSIFIGCQKNVQPLTRLTAKQHEPPMHGSGQGHPCSCSRQVCTWWCDQSVWKVKMWNHDNN